MKGGGRGGGSEGGGRERRRGEGTTGCTVHTGINRLRFDSNFVFCATSEQAYWYIIFIACVSGGSKQYGAGGG